MSVPPVPDSRSGAPPPHLPRPPGITWLKSPWLQDSRAIGALAAVVPGGSLLAWAHFVAPFQFQQTVHRWTLEGRPGGPNIRVLHLSDLHLRRPDRLARAMARAARASAPWDLAVVTGDLVSPGYDRGGVVDALRLFPRPPLGVYAVPGNWEYWSGLDGSGFDALCADVGWVSLRNRSVDLTVQGGPLRLVGLDDLLAGAPRTRDEVDSGASGPTVVLAHCPAHFPDAVRDAEVMLSGHAHGGQVRLPGLGAPWLPAGCRTWDQGWFIRPGGRRLFVHRGSGCAVLRVRWSCPPEIAVHEIGGAAPTPAR